jgi:hypothetical protein
MKSLKCNGSCVRNAACIYSTALSSNKLFTSYFKRKNNNDIVL